VETSVRNFWAHDADSPSCSSPTVTAKCRARLGKLVPLTHGVVADDQRPALRCHSNAGLAYSSREADTGNLIWLATNACCFQEPST